MQTIPIQSKYYCGTDLHDQTSYLYIMDAAGNQIKHKNIKNDLQSFKQMISPYLGEIVVGAESTHNYYWLSDLCQKEGIPFYLGHAYYLRAIRGKKNKNDKLDAKAIANQMRMNHFPISYAYPEKGRSIRDLMRRRIRTVRMRSGLLNNIHLIYSQHGLAEVTKNALKSQVKRSKLPQDIGDEITRFTVKRILNMIEYLSMEIKLMERMIIKKAKIDNPEDLRILKSFPGIGDIIALTMIYEIDKISRFNSVQNFSSYARVVRAQRESAGKKTDNMNSKIGNPYLKWAFSQSSVLSVRYSAELNNLRNRLATKHGKKKALSIFRHKVAIAVYYMLKKKEEYNEKKFIQTVLNN